MESNFGTPNDLNLLRNIANKIYGEKVYPTMKDFIIVHQIFHEYDDDDNPCVVIKEIAMRISLITTFYSFHSSRKDDPIKSEIIHNCREYYVKESFEEIINLINNAKTSKKKRK